MNGIHCWCKYLPLLASNNIAKTHARPPTPKIQPKQNRRAFSCIGGKPACPRGTPSQMVVSLIWLGFSFSRQLAAIIVALHTTRPSRVCLNISGRFEKSRARRGSFGKHDSMCFLLLVLCLRKMRWAPLPRTLFSEYTNFAMQTAPMKSEFALDTPSYKLNSTDRCVRNGTRSLWSKVPAQSWVFL